MRIVRPTIPVAVVLVGLCACGTSGSSLSGKVVLPGVADASGVPVTVSGPTAATGVTDRGGAYHLTRLEHGRYVVVATVTSTVEGTRSATVTVGGAETTAPDLDFTPAGRLSGTVLVVGGGPAVGATVAVAGTTAVAVTGSDGSFELDLVPAGAHTVTASLTGIGSAAANDVVVPYDGNVAVPALVLQPAGSVAATISGRVVLTGLASITNVTVDLAGPVDGTTAPGTSGGFAFTGLPPGSYTVTATAPSTVEGSRSVDVVAIAGKAATTSDLVLTPVGRVTGRATLGGATAGNAGIAVRLSGATRSVVALTDDAGDYAADAAPIGPVTIQAVHSGYGVGCAAVPAVGYAQTSTAPQIDLSPGGSGTADLGRVQGSASLIGRTDVTGLTITLENTAATLPPVLATSDGRYEIDGVPAGIYTVHLQAGPFEETVPGLLAIPSDTALVLDEAAPYPLPPIQLPRARHIAVAKGSANFEISPDGSYLMYGADADQATQTFAIRVVPTAGGASVPFDRMTNGSLRVFSPDGSNVVALEQLHQPGVPDGGAALMVMPTSGGLPRTLASPVNHSNLWFTPDGAYAIFLANPDAIGFTWSLESVPLAGGPVKVLDSGVNPLRTAVVTHGHKVMFVTRYNSPGGDLVLASADGSSSIVLSTNDVDPFLQALPDGSGALFFTANGALNVARFADGSVVQLATSAQVYSLRPISGGSLLLFQDLAGALDVVHTAGGPATELVPAAVGVSGFWVTADGLHVMFVGSSSPQPLGVVPLSGGPIVTVTTGVFFAYHDWNVATAPVVFLTGVDPVSHVGELDAIPTGGGAVTRLASGVRSVSLKLTPNWDRAIFVDDANDICAVPTAGGTVVTLGSNLGSNVIRLSPDGTHVVLVVPATPGTYFGTLKTISTAGGPVVDVSTNADGPSGFSPDGHHLLFLHRTFSADGTQLLTLESSSVDGGPPTPIMDGGAMMGIIGGEILVRRATAALPFQDGFYLAPVP